MGVLGPFRRRRCHRRRRVLRTRHRRRENDRQQDKRGFDRRVGAEHPNIVSSPDESSKLKSTSSRPKKRRKRFSFIRFFILLFLAAGLFAGGLGYWGYKQFEKDLPDRWSALTDYKPSRASRVFSSDGELIGEFYLQKRIVLPYDRIPPHVRNAFVAAEDNRFFDHHGIDPLGILRAAFANIKAG